MFKNLKFPNVDYIFDFFDAHYLFASDYHEGQDSDLYTVFAQLRKLGYEPGMMLCYSNLSEKSKAIYDKLEKNL